MSPFVRPAIVRAGDRLCARSVLLVVLGILTLTFSGSPGSRGDELDFQTARALAWGNGLALGGTPEMALLRGDGEGLTEIDGATVSTRPIGAPLASVPFYWLGQLVAPLAPEVAGSDAAPQPPTEYVEHLVVGWRGALLAALTAWMVVLASRRVGAGRRHAWLGGLAFVLSTWMWPQARTASVDVPATFFLFLAFHLTIRSHERFVRLLRPMRLDLVGIGVGLAMAVLTRPSLAPAALVIACAVVLTIVTGYRRLAQFALFLRRTWRLGHWVDFAWVAAPLVVAVALCALDPVTRGVTPIGRPEQLVTLPSDDPLGDLALLLVAPGGGIVWLAPLVLLAPLGLAVAQRHGARLWPLCAGLVALSVLWSAQHPLTESEPWGFGPGRLLPALPFLWLGVAFALDHAAREPRLRAVACALCILGMVANLGGVLVDTHTWQDLLVQSAEEGPATPRATDHSGASRRRDPHALFDAAQWDPRLAQPWACWRILRHRLAAEDEAFPAGRIFLGARAGIVAPRAERDRRFRHVAWVAFRDRYGRRPDSAILAALVLVATGCILAVRGLDRALP